MFAVMYPNERLNKSLIYATTAGYKNSFSYEKLLQIFPINSDEHINCITFQKKSTYHSSLLWIQNNTIIISSQRHLFDMIKFCNESRSFGVPLNNEKVHQFLKI